MMSPITLSSHLITRLSTLSSNDTGYLIGLYPDMKHDDKHIHVIGSVKGDDSTLASIRLSLPTGCLDIVGTYTTSTSTSTSTSSFPLTFQYNIDTHDIKITSHGATITYTVDDTITLNQYIPFRLIYTHDTYVYTRDGLKSILSSYINNLSSITLHIPSTDQLIPNYSHTDADIWNDTCTSLVNEHKSTSWMERVTTMNVMENMDVEGGDAPVVMYTNGLSQHTIYPITIHIDVLCFASTTDTIDTVLHTCITRVGEYLQHIISNIDNDMNDTVLIRDGHDLSRMILRTYHFIPSTLSHPITLMYPSYTYHDMSTSDDESYLLSRRQSLHTTWCLPMDRPILRITNALSWDTSSTSTSGRLHNVHLHIPSSPIQGGTQYLVSGEYAYYHYMQDKFNDAGWGCAYRTLQTICSWYILNHYVHGRTIPTHRDIQQILVEHDGKPRTLIGSREWIGAIEVGTVLNHWMNVESRNLFITSGSEIPTHARDLAKHFQTQGTPVMIGGGQLAYGLLGIDWNAKTGECAYLILDPHYTGGEHIQTIIGKGWCGWKGPELFLPNEFYNFCLPQRPHQI